MQVSLGLKPLMAYSARSVSLSAYLHSTFLPAFEKVSPVISVWSVLCKQEGTREGKTAWHLLWDFSPCIPFQLWYEVGCACCSCAFEASRIAVCETLAGTVYISVLPYVCKCIFCVVLDVQLPYCRSLDI